jgi:hypothetical protein
MYRHKQVGYLMLIIFGSGGLLLAWRIATHGATIWLLIGLAVFLSCFVTFSSLTVQISDGKFSWFFGPGLFRKEMRLNDIVQVRSVRNSWTNGWGIHRISNGWQHNVSGFWTVEIVMKNGEKFRIGTDRPEELVTAIKLAVSR